MAKVIQVVQYEAEDGSIFLTAAEADAHDFKLKNGELIKTVTESFVNSIGAIDRSRNMQINTVSAFLAFYLPWVEAGSVPVERTVFDTPKAEVVEGETQPTAESVADQAPAAGEPAVF